MRTILDERHQPRFEALSPICASLVLERLKQHCALRTSTGPVSSGAELFALCRDAGLDHAGVVLTLATETSRPGLQAIEVLVGHPIVEWSATVAARAATAPKLPARGVAVQKPRDVDGKFVVSVVPNPKKPGSATHIRFAQWVVGRTVAQCMSAGLTRADVDWDVSRNFVVLGDAPT